jgi:hypothetical protein
LFCGMIVVGLESAPSDHLTVSERLLLEDSVV